jgi:hypothetical protein
MNTLSSEVETHHETHHEHSELITRLSMNTSIHLKLLLYKALVLLHEAFTPNRVCLSASASDSVELVSAATVYVSLAHVFALTHPPFHPQ